MASISVDINWDDSNVSSHGETFSIYSGAVLTVNSDPQWSQKPYYLGILDIYNGEIHFDGTTVRMLAFTSASTLPVVGETCTGQTSGATGFVIRVTGNTTAGTVKLRSVSGGPFQNAETLSFGGGKTATANGADTVGWLLIVGGEGFSFRPRRIGTVRVSGVWYDLGKSTGGSGQTFQHYVTDIVPVVWVERLYKSHATDNSSGSTSFVVLGEVDTNAPQTGSFKMVKSNQTEEAITFTAHSYSATSNKTTFTLSSAHAGGYDGASVGGVQDIFQMWLNVGGRFNATYIGLEERGEFFSMTQGTATITFGNGSTYGKIPPVGARIVVPNIHFASTTSGSWPTETRTISTTQTNQYTFLGTYGGNFIAEKFIGAGVYCNLKQAYSVDLSNVGWLRSIIVQKVVSTCVLSFVGIGYNGTDSSTSSVFEISYNRGISTVLNDCKAVGTGTSGGILYFLSSGIITGDRCTGYYLPTKSTSSNAIRVQDVSEITLNEPFACGSRLQVFGAKTITLSNTKLSDTMIGADVSTNAQQGIICEEGVDTLLIDGVKISPNGTRPRNTLIGLSRCTHTKLRNIGTPASPLDLTNQTGYVYDQYMSGGAGRCVDLEVSRVYCINTRTTFQNSDNTNNGVVIQNVRSDATDGYDIGAFNVQLRGARMTDGSFSASPAVGKITDGNIGLFGNHFFDVFTSDTAGAVGIICTEKTSLSPSVNSYSITAGTPYFDSGSGKVFFETAGDEIIWEWQWFVLGTTGFSAHNDAYFDWNNYGNLTVRYQIDLGSGWNGTWLTLGNLINHTVTPAVGFKLKVKVTCDTGDVNNWIRGMRFLTTTTAGDQQTQYPLGITAVLSLTELQANTEVRIYDQAGTELGGIENSGTTYNFSYLWTSDFTVDIVIHHVNYEAVRYENVNLTEAGLTVIIQQRLDRNYSNP